MNNTGGRRGRSLVFDRRVESHRIACRWVGRGPTHIRHDQIRLPGTRAGNRRRVLIKSHPIVNAVRILRRRQSAPELVPSPAVHHDVGGVVVREARVLDRIHNHAVDRPIQSPRLIKNSVAVKCVLRIEREIVIMNIALPVQMVIERHLPAVRRRDPRAVREELNVHFPTAHVIPNEK